MLTREPIAKAAKALDVAFPGWYERVRPHDIDMASCTKCILGQTMGERNWSTSEENNVNSWRALNKELKETFHLDDGVFASRRSAPFWVEEINARLTAATAKDPIDVEWSELQQMEASTSVEIKITPLQAPTDC